MFSLNGRVCRYEEARFTDTFRDVLDLTEKMRKRLGEGSLKGMSAVEVRKLVEREKEGMPG